MITQYIDKAKSFQTITEYQDWLMLLSKQHKATPDLRESCNYVKGCSSYLWITGAPDKYNKWYFESDSKTIFGKAVLKILTDSVNGLPANEIKVLTFRQFSPILNGVTIQQQQGFQAALNKIKQIVDKA